MKSKQQKHLEAEARRLRTAIQQLQSAVDWEDGLTRRFGAGTSGYNRIQRSRVDDLAEKRGLLAEIEKTLREVFGA